MLGRMEQDGMLAQPVRLGIIVNPNARYLQSHRGVQSMMQMVGTERVVTTKSVDELPEALSFLFDQQKITVLGICGGDGTIHHTVNALLRFCQQESSTGDRVRSIPPLLLLRGGTLNIVARAIRATGHSVPLLRTFLQRFQHARICDLPLSRLRLLGVKGPEPEVRYGFIFGSAITAHCLLLYEKQFGAGYLGLIKFLQAVVRAYWKKDALWHQFQPMLVNPEGRVSLDDESFLYQAVVASSVNIQLLGGLITGMRCESQRPGVFAVRMLLPQSPGTLVRNLPNLVLGREGTGIVDRQDVGQIHIHASIQYSLDGEVFVPQILDPLEISSPAWTLPVVSPFP